MSVRCGASSLHTAIAKAVRKTDWRSDRRIRLCKEISGEPYNVLLPTHRQIAATVLLLVFTEGIHVSLAWVTFPFRLNKTLQLLLKRSAVGVDEQTFYI